MQQAHEKVFYSKEILFNQYPVWTWIQSLVDLRQTFWRNSLGNLYNYEDLFEADAKLYKGIKNEEDCNILQDDLDKICRWSKKWEMELNGI